MKSPASPRNGQPNGAMLLPGLGVGTWEWDIRTGKVSVSPDLREIQGLDPAADVVQGVEALRPLLHRDDSAGAVASLNAALGSGRDFHEQRFRILRPDGEIRHILSRARLLRDADGAPVKLVGADIDVTVTAATDAPGTQIPQGAALSEAAATGLPPWRASPAATATAGDGTADHLQAQEALAKSEARFRATFENAAVGMAHVAPDGSWLLANSRLCEILGYRSEELLTSSFQQVTHPEDLQSDMLQVGRMLDGEIDSYAMEKRYLRKDGGIIWCRLTVGCVRKPGNGAVDCFISVVEDISERKQAEEQRRESEERLRFSLAAASAGCWDWNIRSGAVAWSPENDAIYDYTPGGGPLSYADWAARVHPDDLASAELAIQKALDGSVPEYRAEFRIVHQDGSVKWLQELGQVERDAEGRPFRMSGINLDITERKRNDERLRESEQLFRGIFEHAGTGIAITDIAGGFRSCNPAFSAMLGYTEDEFCCVNFLNLVHPDDRDANRVETLRLLTQEVPSLEISNRYLRKDGRPVWVHKHISLLWDTVGNPAGMVALVTDITEAKCQEERLRRSHDTYLSLIQNNPFGVFLIDADFRVAQISVGARKAFSGITPLQGRDFADVLRIIWTEPFASEAIALFRHTLDTGEPYHSADTTAQRSNIELVESYDWRIERVTLPDGHLGVVCFFYDMTERKRHEAHVRLLMQEVNHRSKNTLSLVQAVARHTAASGAADFIKRFEARIQALSASQDLLVKSEWSGVWFDELARNQLAHFDDQVETRITLRGPRLKIAPAASQTLGMALHELGTNAAKYGALSSGAGRIEVVWSLDRAETGQLWFSIRWLERDGPPVSVPLRRGFGTALISDLARVGLDADVTLDYAATGLVWGLRCKAGNIIEGSGTNPDEPPEAPVATLENATQRTILVVEDEPLLALEIVDALAAAGFHVLGPALSVSQAVDLLRQASCDAAVMDIHLGRETSELVVRMLLHQDIPMVTLSSYSPDQRPTAFDGIPGLSKPIQPKLLIAELRRCLEQPEASKRW